MTSTRFTELVGCTLPLQLAGMGGIGTDVALPAAISTAGGLGMLGAAGLPADGLAALLELMSETTSAPFGVNFLMPFLDHDAVAVAAARSRLVEFFYGNPDRSLVDLVHARGALAGWQVGTKDEALAAEEAGCDLVAVQGTEAGGHIRGTQPLAQVLSEVLAVIGVPVLAAGGVGSAADVAKHLDAGASGVRVGTRFLASHEAIAHPQYIEALIAATATDTELTDTFSYGWPDAPPRAARLHRCRTRHNRGVRRDPGRRGRGVASSAIRDHAATQDGPRQHRGDGDVRGNVRRRGARAQLGKRDRPRVV
jgi:nitronate monooxygenase